LGAAHSQGESGKNLTKRKGRGGAGGGSKFQASKPQRDLRGYALGISDHWEPGRSFVGGRRALALGAGGSGKAFPRP